MRQTRHLWLIVSAAVVLSAGARSQSGIRVTDPDKVLLGQAANCTRPAQVDYKKLQEATPEFRTIRDEGIEKGSARYELLIRKMTQRLRELIKDYAGDKGIDCVVVKGAVKDAQKLTVIDITQALLEKLESESRSGGDTG